MQSADRCRAGRLSGLLHTAAGVANRPPAYDVLMQCNIDAKGKAVRLIAGICCIVAGIVPLILHQSSLIAGPGWLIAGIVLVAIGAFAVYEGWAGWCALRAMGFRTRV